jgi:hypothetical protein
MYAYIIFNWLFLQVIYMTCAQLYPEEKGATFFELREITCPVMQHHIPNKYLEKLHDFKCSFKLFLSRFLGTSLNFTSDQLIQETSWIQQTYLVL